MGSCAGISRTRPSRRGAKRRSWFPWPAPDRPPPRAASARPRASTRGAPWINPDRRAEAALAGRRLGARQGYEERRFAPRLEGGVLEVPAHDPIQRPQSRHIARPEEQQDRRLRREGGLLDLRRIVREIVGEERLDRGQEPAPGRIDRPSVVPEDLPRIADLGPDRPPGAGDGRDHAPRGEQLFRPGLEISQRPGFRHPIHPAGASRPR